MFSTQLYAVCCAARVTMRESRATLAKTLAAATEEQLRSACQP